MADQFKSDALSAVGAPSTYTHVEEKAAPDWVPWLLALGVLAMLWFLLRPRHHEVVTTTTTTETSAAISATATGLGDYLAGTDAVPRTFTFDKLKFDTASNAIRSVGKPDLNDIAATLKRYANTRVKIVGYADARGDTAMNAVLGKSRPDSVKAALVAQGIDAARIDTASSGESAPIASNVTSQGQAENRRTELVVISR